MFQFWLNFTEVCSQWCNWEQVSIGSENGWSPNSRRQAITWASDGLVYWYTYASLIITSFANWYTIAFNKANKSTGDRWISLTKASDAELWCFLWFTPEQTVEQTLEMPVVWDAFALLMTPLSCEGHTRITLCSIHSTFRIIKQFIFLLGIGGSISCWVLYNAWVYLLMQIHCPGTLCAYGLPGCLQHSIHQMAPPCRACLLAVTFHHWKLPDKHAMTC